MRTACSPSRRYSQSGVRFRIGLSERTRRLRRHCSRNHQYDHPDSGESHRHSFLRLGPIQRYGQVQHRLGRKLEVACSFRGNPIQFIYQSLKRNCRRVLQMDLRQYLRSIRVSLPNGSRSHDHFNLVLQVAEAAPPLSTATPPNSTTEKCSPSRPQRMPARNSSDGRMETEELAEVAEPTLDTTTVTMTKAITIKAIFQDEHHDVALSTSGGGNLDGNGSFLHGSSPTISATPLTGYKFMKWEPATGLTDSNLATTTIQSLDQDRAYTADFDPVEYTSAQIEGQTSHGGNVELQAGPKLHFSDYSLRAIPWRGYSFVNWTSSTNSLGALSSPLDANATLTVDGPANFTAHFAENQYSLSVGTPNNSWGTVSPSDNGPYLFSQAIPVSANAGTGYKFSNWTGDIGALLDPLASSTDANMSVLAKNVSLQAHFAPKTYVVETNSTTGGSITATPPATVQHKVTYPIKATAEPGYVFTGWESNSSSQVIILETVEETMLYISNTPGFSLEEGDKISVTAKFSALPYSLSASASSGGKVKITGMTAAATQGNGTFPADETPTIEAIPNTGYLFSHWSEDNATLINATAPTTTVNMAMLDRNVTLEAKFAKKTYNLTAQVSGSGKVDGVDTLSKTYSHFDQATFLATPSAGWYFDHWSWDDAANFPGASQPSASFIVAGAVNSTAHFSRNLYQLSFVNVLNGSAAGSGNHSYDSNVTITATPHEGYAFSHWSGPSPLPLAAADASTTTVRIPVGDIALTPNFAPKGGIVAEVQSSGQGSVSGGGIFLFDSNVTVSATAASADGNSPIRLLLQAMVLEFNQRHGFQR